MKKYISIDIGGTAIKYGLIGQGGEILSKKSMDTEAYKGGPAILDKVLDITQGYLNDQGQAIVGVCISTAGMVDRDKGEIFYSAPLIPNYKGTNFKKAIRDKFNLACEVENDVKCAGLAEYMAGASKGASLALMLTIGTGIGGCIIIDGRVLRGFSGSACEVGYLNMGDSDFQSLASARTLTKTVASLKGQPESDWNGYAIFEAAKSGDSVCIGAIDDMCQVLGQGIANIAYVINPEIVVLGGGIMAQEDYLRPRIEAALNKYLIDSIASQTRIEFASHGNDAGMLGAYYNFVSVHG